MIFTYIILSTLLVGWLAFVTDNVDATSTEVAPKEDRQKRTREYQRKYRDRPDVKERRKAYMEKYREVNKSSLSQKRIERRQSRTVEQVRADAAKSARYWQNRMATEDEKKGEARRMKNRERMRVSRALNKKSVSTSSTGACELQGSLVQSQQGRMALGEGQSTGSPLPFIHFL
jgi:hypothetical protein